MGAGNSHLLTISNMGGPNKTGLDTSGMYAIQTEIDLPNRSKNTPL